MSTVKCACPQKIDNSLLTSKQCKFIKNIQLFPKNRYIVHYMWLIYKIHLQKYLIAYVIKQKTLKSQILMESA